MVPLFFLSFAKADQSPLLKRFIEDLQDTIAAKAGGYENDELHYCRQSESSEWAAETAEALRTSRMLLPLLSPAYFSDKMVGKHWQVFEMRKQAYVQRLGHPEISAEILMPVITPLSWKEWEIQAPGGCH